MGGDFQNGEPCACRSDFARSSPISVPTLQAVRDRRFSARDCDGDAAANGAEHILRFATTGSRRAEDRHEFRLRFRGATANIRHRRFSGPDRPTADRQPRPLIRRPSSKPTVTDWPPLASSERASPRRFGDYELLEEIARGGMGVVFKARHVRLGGVVALKMILAGELASHDDVLRFHIEAEAASKLAHPNIVPIYEVGRVDGQHYFTMRLIEGKNLASRIDAGPLDPCLAAELLRDIALAVQHAHEHGVIHRDLKPDNILLDADGRPHITDFGVARRTYERSNLTDAGQVLGTPSYMSPEQAAGEPNVIGPAADIYSLGAVLYTMLTGRPPLECHRIDILAQLMEYEPIVPRRLNLRIPPDLETICLKCLAKQPRKRYASAADLAADLNRFLANQPIHAKAACLVARASRWIRRQPRTAAAVAFAMGVFLLSLTGLAWQWRRAEQAQADATESRYVAHLAQAQASRWSGRAGGRFAAMAALKKAAAIRPSIALRNEAIACMTQFDLRLERTLEVGARLGMPGFTGGLDRLAYIDKQGTISVCDWLNSRTLCRFSAGRPSEVLRQGGVRFSPDGSHLAAAMQYDGGHELSLWDLKRSRAVIQVAQGARAMAIDFSPDGTTLAAGQPDGTLALYQTSDGARISSRNLDLIPHAIRFAPDGSTLAVSADNVAWVLDLKIQDPLQILMHPAAVHAVAWSPDGELLATACADHCVYLWDSQTGERLRVLPGRQHEAVYVVFNHCGDLLASHGRDGRTQLWNVRTGTMLMRTTGLALAFRDDDKQLAFYGADIGTWRVASGRKRRILESTTPMRVWHAEIDADNRMAVLAREDGVRFWELASTTEIGWLDIGPVRLASFEPDGRGLITWGAAGLLRWPIRPACRSGDELVIGPPERLSLPAPALPAFGAMSANGQTVAVSDRAYGELFLYDLHHRRLLFRGPHAHAGRMAISHDGAWVAGGTCNDPHPAVRRWDARLPAQVGHWACPDDALPAFSPDGSWLWIGAPQKGRLIDANTWETVRTQDIEGAAVGAGVFSPDSALLALNSSTDRLQLVEPATGKEIAALETSIPLCFNRQGSLLLTQSDDCSVQVWDLARIRRRLADLNLDWNTPALPPARRLGKRSVPLRIQIVGKVRQAPSINGTIGPSRSSNRTSVQPARCSPLLLPAIQSSDFFREMH